MTHPVGELWSADAEIKRVMGVRHGEVGASSLAVNLRICAH
jgi:hypothetical protein